MSVRPPDKEVQWLQRTDALTRRDSALRFAFAHARSKCGELETYRCEFEMPMAIVLYNWVSMCGGVGLPEFLMKLRMMRFI